MNTNQGRKEVNPQSAARCFSFNGKKDSAVFGYREVWLRDCLGHIWIGKAWRLAIAYALCLPSVAPHDAILRLGKQQGAAWSARSSGLGLGRLGSGFKLRAQRRPAGRAAKNDNPFLRMMIMSFTLSYVRLPDPEVSGYLTLRKVEF